MLWFLPTLIGADILTVGLLKTKNKVLKWMFIVVLLSYAIVFCVIKNELGLSMIALRPLEILNRFAIACLFCLIGFYMAVFGLTQKIKPLVVIFCIAVCLLLSQYSNVDVHWNVIGNPVVFLITATGGSFAIIGLSQLLSKSKILAF